jgi:hypothetical protein
MQDQDQDQGRGQDQDQNIGFQNPDEDEMPSEMKEYGLAAFRHAAGFGPHPGTYQGPPRKRRDPDEEPPSGEASAEKMHAAQTGGSPGLGPTEAQANLAKQRAVLQQKAAQQSEVAAQQAQAQQTSPTPPPAPSGPQGVSQPYPAQAGQAPEPEGP